MQRAKIYCIGELLIDFVAENQGSDLSKALNFTKKAGGAPANVACAVSKLGGRGYFIGCVGNDPFGDFLINTLKDSNVDVTLAQRSEVFTTLAFVSIAEDGERDFVFSRGADIELKYDPDNRKALKKGIVHFGAATALLGGSLEEAYGHYLFDALCNETFISFDPNFRGDLWKNNEELFVKKCMPYIEKSHLCKFSLEEALLLSGESSAEKACETLHKIGAKVITITLGKDGTLVSTEKTQKVIESVKVSPVDTTGAGDAFIGCLLHQIAELNNFHRVYKETELLYRMVRKANKAGALTTTKFGAIAALPTEEELENA